MHIRRFLFSLLLLGVFITAYRRAESAEDSTFNPETVLLSHFSLVRPKHWQWVSTGPHEGSVLMEVIYSMKDPQSPNNPVMIHFVHMKPNTDIATPPATARRWTTWFQSVKKSARFSPAKTIGTNNVSFIEMTGTYQSQLVPGKKPNLRPGYTLVGAHVEDNEGNILIRMVGPAGLVEKNKQAFNEMIENSVQSK